MHSSHLLTSARLFGIFLLLIATSFIPARGQVFQLQGGSSSLFGAHGGTVQVQSSDYQFRLSSGFQDGARVGFSLGTELFGNRIHFGDDTIPFRMPTDLFGGNHYLLGRGLGIARQNDRLSLYGFAGGTSTGRGIPFMRTARAERAVGLFFLDTTVRPSLALFSRNVFSDRQTILNGLEWRPSTNLRAGVTGGIGANQGYFASSLNTDRGWVSLLATYVRAGDRFRRATISAPLNVEADRENVRLVLRPSSYLRLSAARQNFLQSPTTGPSLRGTVNQYGASLNAAGFVISGRLFDSRSTIAKSRGSSLYVRRPVTRRVEASGNLLRSGPSRGPRTTTLVATLREVISPRLSLTQVVNRSQGRTTVSYGGDFLSNLVTVGLQYQTFFVPLRSDNQFQQTLVMNLRFRLPGNLQGTSGTRVLPDGRVRYTAYANSFAYREQFAAGSRGSVSLAKYLLQGQVIDSQGRPIRGAALRIGNELIFTDSQGRFFLRARKSRQVRLEVLVEEFLVPGRFEVVSAPEHVKALPDGQAPEIMIVVRRLRIT